jgi:signal transduction histidine kinase
MTVNSFYREKVLLTFFLLQFLVSLSQSPIPALITSLEKEASAIKKADICFTLSILYADRLKIDSAIFFADKIKELSLPAGYETGSGKYYFAFAAALHYRNKNDEAEKNVLKAIGIFTRQKEILLLGRAYSQLARIQHAVNNVNAARKSYWTAINYSVSCEDHSGAFRSYYFLARLYHKSSQIDSAAFYHVKALAMAEQLKDLNRIHESACWVGISFLSLGDLDKASKYLEYGLNSNIPSGDKVQRRFFLRDYVMCLALMHDFSRADSAIKEFELMNVKLSDDWGRISLNKIKGVLEYERKNYAQALHYLQKAYSKQDDLKTFNNEIKEIVFLLGKAEYQTHNYDSAIRHLQTAAKLSYELRDLPVEMEANRLISKSFEMKRNADSALFYFSGYSLLKDSMLSIQKQKTIIEVAARYETEKKEQTITLLQKESEANSYLIRLQNQQIEKQLLEDEKKSQQLEIISQISEINKLDAAQKKLNLDNEKKDNAEKQARVKLLEKEAEFQKLFVSKQNQQKRIIYAGIAAILAFVFYLLYRYVHRKKLQNQKEVLNERLRISRELHDEVGSTLTGIAMYSHLTREQIKAQKTEEVEKSLNNMQQSAGDMVSKLNDIVWLVNPEKDTLQKIMERLEEYAEEMAMIKNIEVRINTPPKLSTLNLPVKSRRNIYLFCKEAINNAVKYSHASVIELSVKEFDNKRIEFSITDNGNGFDAVAVKKGNGLVNMQQRTRDINGEFSLRSSPGHGTTISLTCKIT